jgi:beta-lactamase class A
MRGLRGVMLGAGMAALTTPSMAADANLVKATSARPSASGHGAYAVLRSALNGDMQLALERSLYALQLDGAARKGRLAVALVDITDPESPRMAQVNGDRMFYAASLPKIAILLGAFQKAAERGLTLDTAAIDELKQMIRKSSNAAATDMLQKVGTRYLAGVLQSPRYRLYDPALGGGLWVGKPYSASGATMRDPLHNISHGATAYQVARFYYLLETGRLVSPEASRQMKTIMGSPEIHHKFVAGLEKTHPESKIFRKSGSWRSYHADSAIVERDGRRYIAVGLAEDPNGGAWMSELIVAMDDIVFGRPVRVASRTPARKT